MSRKNSARALSGGAFPFLGLWGLLDLVVLCGTVGCSNVQPGQTGSTSSLTNTPNSEIIGGQKIPDEQQDARRQSTVALTTDTVSPRAPDKGPLIDRGSSFCSGTLISDRIVMTAAHCIQKFDETTRTKQDGFIFDKPDQFIASFNTKVSRNGKWIRAKKVIPHPDWDPTATLSPISTTPPNDLGLIILSQPAPEGMKPAQIASLTETLANGSDIFLAGYGVSLSRNLNDTGTLRQVQVKVSNLDKTAFRLSVGALFKGACAGDSGGPAFVKVGDDYKVVGATSTGAEIFGVCLGVINNYTDARHYSDWIRRTAESEGLTL